MSIKELEAPGNPLDTPPGTALSRAQRYYRPELDLLRFTAFFLVFLFHGPYLQELSLLQRAGQYGLGLFFYLSAFLITELLLRERELLGTVHLRAFYIRRLLRIWPLYYIGGIGSALLWSYLTPNHHLSQNELFYLLFFLGFLGEAFHWNPAGVLWSVSVEELFYAVWPWAGKLGHFRLAIAIAFAGSITVILIIKDTWYNPIAQFFFFAAGALTALLSHGKPLHLPDKVRALFLLLAIALLVYGSGRERGLTWYLIGAGGCALLLLGLLDIRPSLIPGPIRYLGKISYGLYVFHRSCLVLAGGGVDRAWHLPEPLRAIVVQCLALLMSVAIAAISYRFLELPFLKQKSRFEFVRSRPPI